MSYSFSFDQFPTKEFFALWEDFSQGNLSVRIDEKIASLERHKEELLKSPISSQVTFYENQEEWVRCEKNHEAVKKDEGFISSWQSLKKTILQEEDCLANAKNEKALLATARRVVAIFMELFGKQNPFAPRILFVSESEGYSDSARSHGYFFLSQLFHRVHGVHLDSMKEMPTNEQWYTMYQSLTPEFVEAEFVTFFADEHISDAEREQARKECLQLLHGIKDLLKGCIDRQWDLWFRSEFQTTNVEEKKKKALAKECVQMILKQKGFSG